MITETAMLYLYVETPLHVGSGSGLSSIDLPIQRERTTQYPMIQGSGIKGKLRAIAEDLADKKTLSGEEVNVIFGPANNNGVEHAGALIAGDARILLFPVRSLSGVFAYTTSSDVLNRFRRDGYRGLGALNWTLPVVPEHTALVTTQSRVTAEDSIVLEEFSFDIKASAEVDTLATWLANNAFPQTAEYAYWREKIQNSLVILPENDFRDFVVNATEVITRVRIDRKKKTVEGGALWTEEHLPADTLMYVPIYATNARKSKGSNDNTPTHSAAEILQKAQTLGAAHNNYVQLGGDETVGRGMVRMQWSQQKKGEQ